MDLSYLMLILMASLHQMKDITNQQQLMTYFYIISEFIFILIAIMAITPLLKTSN